ncbi:MAG: hypothetical protein SPI77_07135 [Corynebacterium sp.]|nr:hypothetical protein [Corynebacterium sp.]
MKTLRLLAATALLATSASLSALAPGAAPQAAAATVTPCSNDEVTVMVEGFTTACAPAGLSGSDTLREVGLEVEYARDSGSIGGFICRIGGKPDARQETCEKTSSANDYWAYWHAPLGGREWEYSDLGADLYREEAGTVVAWTRGDGEVPGEIPAPRIETTDGTADVAVGDSRTAAVTSRDPNTGFIDDVDDATKALADAVGNVGRDGETVTDENGDLQVIVYQDEYGNPITKQQYDEIMAQIAAGTYVSGGENGVPPLPAPVPPADTDGATGATTDRPAGRDITTGTSVEQPQSTLVRKLPGGGRDDIGAQNSTGDTSRAVALDGTNTTAMTDDSATSKLMLGIGIALVVVVAAAAGSAAVMRRKAAADSL